MLHLPGQVWIKLSKKSKSTHRALWTYLIFPAAILSFVGVFIISLPLRKPPINTQYAMPCVNLESLTWAVSEVSGYLPVQGPVDCSVDRLYRMQNNVFCIFRWIDEETIDLETGNRTLIGLFNCEKGVGDERVSICHCLLEAGLIIDVQNGSAGDVQYRLETQTGEIRTVFSREGRSPLYILYRLDTDLWAIPRSTIMSEAIVHSLSSGVFTTFTRALITQHFLSKGDYTIEEIIEDLSARVSVSGNTIAALAQQVLKAFTTLATAPADRTVSEVLKPRFQLDAASEAAIVSLWNEHGSEIQRKVANERQWNPNSRSCAWTIDVKMLGRRTDMLNEPECTVRLLTGENTLQFTLNKPLLDDLVVQLEEVEARVKELVLR